MAPASMLRHSQLDAPRLYAASLNRQASQLAAELEGLLPESRRAGFTVSRTGEVTIFVAGGPCPLPLVLSTTANVRVQHVTWSRAEIEHASMEHFDQIPDELCEGILADWFDPAINGLRVEVAPWWEGTAARLARYLGVPVETTVFHGVGVTPLHVVEAPTRG